MDGVRPDRPPSGLSDTLWELLVATWAVQHAQEPGGRPPAWTILDRLKETVDDWGRSIVPPVPEYWQDGESHVPERTPQFINVLSTVADSDEDVSIGGDTMASGFCDRIGYPVVGE